MTTTMTRPFDFDGQAPTVRAYLLNVTPPGQMPFNLTVYSPLSRAAFQAQLGAVVSDFTIQGDFDVFHRQSDGTYTWRLPCP